MATKKEKKIAEFKEATPESFDGLKLKEQIQNTPAPESKAEILPAWVQEAAGSVKEETVVNVSESKTSIEKLAIEDAVNTLNHWFDNGATRGDFLNLRDKLRAV